MTYDVIIRNGLWFDGTGTVPQVRTLGIRDGIVAEVSAGRLDETGCTDVIDAVEKWIVPGFIDVHTTTTPRCCSTPG
jgi:N-acyl-D-aspartate/D-glutamate deacylase